MSLIGQSYRLFGLSTFSLHILYHTSEAGACSGPCNWNYCEAGIRGWIEDGSYPRQSGVPTGSQNPGPIKPNQTKVQYDMKLTRT